MGETIPKGLLVLLNFVKPTLEAIKQYEHYNIYIMDLAATLVAK